MTERQQILQHFRMRVGEELDKQYPAAKGYEHSFHLHEDSPGSDHTMTKGGSWGLNVAVHPDNGSLQKVTLQIREQSRASDKMMLWVFNIAGVVFFIVFIVAFVGGIIQGTGKKVGVAAFSGWAAGIAVGLPGLLVVFTIRIVKSMARTSEMADVEKTLGRVWQELQSRHERLPPLARRFSTQAKCFLGAVVSGGAAAGLWFGSHAFEDSDPMLDFVMMALAVAAAIAFFVCLIAAFFHTLRWSLPARASVKE